MQTALEPPTSQPTCPAAPATATFHVRCCGTLHRIHWDGQSVRFQDHRRVDLQFLLALSTTQCRCAEILQVVRTNQHLGRLPQALRSLLEQHREHRRTLHHGRLPAVDTSWSSARDTLRQRGIRHRYGRSQIVLASQGLRARLYAPAPSRLRSRGEPWISLKVGGPHDGYQWVESSVFAVYDHAGWTVDWKKVSEVTRGLTAQAKVFWMGEGNRCIPCGLHHPRRRQPYADGPASTPGTLAHHAASREHWERVTRIIAAAVNVPSPAWQEAMAHEQKKERRKSPDRGKTPVHTARRPSTPTRQHDGKNPTRHGSSPYT
jgi:hypothetical protein